MIERVVGLICLALALYQLFSTRNMLKYTKSKGNENTSGFLPISLWSSIVFSIALFGLGITFLFKLI